VVLEGYWWAAAAAHELGGFDGRSGVELAALML
jgi:hypothetical protein